MDTPQQQVAEAIATHGRPVWIAHVPISIRRQVPYEDILRLLDGASLANRTVKEQAIRTYIAEHTYEEITTAQIAEIMQVSNSTARKYTEDHPDSFRPLRRGVWEIRNAKEDRRG